MNKTDLYILMLEDEPFDAELNKAQLALIDEYHCIITVVADKDSYLKALETKQPDIVLSDYHLPQYNGLEALEDLKARNLLIPFIFVTGTLNEETAVETIKAGAWDYVVKDRLMRLPLAVRNALKLREEKRLLAVTEEKAQRLLTAIEQTSAQIVVTDEKGVIEYVNSRFTEVMGHSMEEAVGKKIMDYYASENNNDLIATAWSKLIEGKVYRGDLLSKNKDGSVCWELVSVTPIRTTEGKTTNYVIVKEDITNRKLIEEELIKERDKAERSDQLKDAFLQNLSHEIRTPLNAIVGFSDLICSKEFNLPASISNYASIIKQSSDQLLSVLSDVLTISSIQKGQEIVTVRNINLNNFMNDLLEKYRPLAEKKNLEFKGYKSITDRNITIESDETKLNQILDNLIDNAIKYTREGSVIVRYEVFDNTIVFSVKDTGIGIDKEAQEHIFEPFRQADDSIHTMYGGIGLGLAISASYANMLGGEIRVESESGKGSTFYFTLPCQTNQTAITDKDPVRTGFIKKTLTILIAEDEYNNFMVLEEYFNHSTTTILHATNGLEAVEMCMQNPAIDLVLMDIKMPVMDGIEAFREIKRLRPDLPVIAQTAYALEKEKRQFLELGFNNYIAKPILKESLFKIINSTLLAKV